MSEQAQGDLLQTQSQDDEPARGDPLPPELPWGKVLQEKKNSHSLPERPQLRNAGGPELTRTLCKRRTGEDIPRAAKFGRIDNSRAQSFTWDLWIKKHSPIRCHGARFGSWKIRDDTKLLGTWKPKVIYTDISLEFGINLWSWPWNYSKVYVDTLPFKKIWDCWIAVCWIGVKSFALLLQSTNQRSKICWKRRKPTVQNLMGLLNSGTLNRGRNFCVTDAIDHSTVDGFHDELQLSAKNTYGKALRRISWVKEFYLVRWKEHHSIFVSDLLKFHHFGSTALPETLSEYVWYAEGEVWKGTLIGSRPWAGGQNRRARIPQCKTQREGDNLAQFGNSSKNRRWTIETFWRRSGENIHFDRGQRTQNEEKFKKTFLEKFHQPPKQEVIAHQHSLYRDQSYPHQNCFEKYFWETCHELLQQADLRRLLQVKQVAFMVLGLSTSSSSSLPSSTSMTPSRQELDHPTSSSSSSTSPTMTSSTVSSDSVAWQERWDLCGVDSYPVTASSKDVESQARWDLWSSGTPEEELLADSANQAVST